MVEPTKDNIKKIRKMAMEYLRGQMGAIIKASGTKADSMVMVIYMVERATCNWQSGRMENAYSYETVQKITRIQTRDNFKRSMLGRQPTLK